MEELFNRNEGEKREYRYYISSLKEDMELFSRSVRGHWSVGCLSILKMIELYRPKLSMKKKRFLIGLKPVRYLEEVLKV